MNNYQLIKNVYLHVETDATTFAKDAEMLDKSMTSEECDEKLLTLVKFFGAEVTRQIHKTTV